VLTLWDVATGYSLYWVVEEEEEGGRETDLLLLGFLAG